MQGCWGSIPDIPAGQCVRAIWGMGPQHSGPLAESAPPAPLGRTVRDFHLTQWGLAVISVALLHRPSPVPSCTSFFQLQPVFLSLLPTIPVKVSRHTFPLPLRNVRAPHPAMSEAPRPWLLWTARPRPPLSHSNLARVSLLQHY